MVSEMSHGLGVGIGVGVGLSGTRGLAIFWEYGGGWVGDAFWGNVRQLGWRILSEHDRRGGL